MQDATESELVEAFYRAEEQMATLSLAPAELIQKYKSHACTDITGFGVLGHANYLAQAQKNKVNLVLNKFPVYKNLIKIEHKVQDFKLMDGYAAETSGGLLICMPKSQVK